MPDYETEPQQATLSIDDRAPVAVNCIRRTRDGKHVLLLWDHDDKPVTGVDAKMIYSDEELRLRFIELEESRSAGVWEILSEGPK